MIYLYGITAPLSRELQATGLESAPLRALPVGPLIAVYSAHAELQVRADAESAWAHEHAVEAVMQLQAILPARFGTTFEDVDELSAAVGRELDGLRERLARLDGCVELAVRINPISSSGTDRGSGQRYLLEKLSDQRRREALAASTLACLKEFALDSRLVASHSQEAVSISYLVRADGVTRFSRAVGRLQGRWPEFGLSCTGPWAPYSFAELPAPAAREKV